jgi:hypothetical protein
LFINRQHIHQQASGVVGCENILPADIILLAARREPRAVFVFPFEQIHGVKVVALTQSAKPFLEVSQGKRMIFHAG